MCIGVSNACYPCGLSRHFTSGWGKTKSYIGSEKHTPVLRPFLGPDQSVVLCGLWGVYIFLFCSALKYHTLYTRGHAESHGLLSEVMLLRTLLTPFSELSQSRILRCEHCSGYRIFLATLIALISKDVSVIPRVIRYLITKRSLTVLPSSFV